MVKIYRHDAVSDGVTYSAVLNDFENGQASEVILKSEPMGMRVMHEADFPTSLLGKASRDGYVRSILQSFVRQHAKDTSAAYCRALYIKTCCATTKRFNDGN